MILRTGRNLSIRNILYPNISGYLFIHKGAGIPSARTDRSRPVLTKYPLHANSISPKCAGIPSARRSRSRPVPTEYPLPEYFRQFVYSQMPPGIPRPARAGRDLPYSPKTDISHKNLISYNIPCTRIKLPIYIRHS